MIAEKLRKSILQAAIQGKLTEQLPEDGDAHSLLAYVLTPQNIKRFEHNPEHFSIAEDEQPFSIPDNWVWVRLGDICTKIGSGSTPSGGRAVYVSAGIKFIRSQNVYNDGLQLDNIAFISPEIDRKKTGSHVYAKDILLNITGASIGRCALVPDDFDVANINQHVLILRLSYEKVREYIHLVMTSPYIYGEIMSAQVGGTKEGLSATKTKQLMIPLPPLSEQLRIIDAVNDAVEKIKELEKDEQKLNLLQKSFPKKMKDSLLQAAIQGKLTERLDSDGDARELVADIQKEKSRLIKEGKIKKDKALPEITEDEIPFDIPDNWCWVRLGEVVLVNGGYAFKSAEYTNTGIRVIRISDFDEHGFTSKDCVFSSYTGKMKHFQIKQNNILMAMTGGTVGKSYLVKECCEDYYVNQRVALICSMASIDPIYIYTVIKSALVQQVIQNKKNSTNDNISLQEINHFFVPLPPLAEQQRVVERLEQLLPLCDALE